MDPNTESVRLNKYLALQLGVSRREADEMIENGLVLVNGEVATLGTQVTPSDELIARGQPVQGGVSFEYIILNKPVGYVCSRSQQGNAPTIYDILPKQYHKLKTVGRLDKDSSGLILLTNDGDFSHTMTHPIYSKTKVYGVHLDRPLEPLHQQMISDRGIGLEDGMSKFELEKILDDRRDMWRVRMSEGRNRQIRRTFAALGYTVTALHRTDFGPYTIGTLQPGEVEETIKK